MAHLLFTVFKRSGRRFFYVKFKNEAGEYLPAVSTKQTTEAAAIETAFKWFREGKPEAGSPVRLSIRQIIKGGLTVTDAGFICRELKRQGLLKTYVMTGSRQAVDFTLFLANFWDYENSPYVREKLRKNHGIHRNYTAGQKQAVEKYWGAFFKGRLLGEITRQDLEIFTDHLAGKEISAARKNIIIKAGTIALRWAYSKEMIDRDITAGIVFFSGKPSERQILTPETAAAVFRAEWQDERARLASLLSAVTGLRAGEIQGLRVQDIGRDCLHIRHSWNGRDKLKTTKNNEPRTIEVPFPDLIQDMVNLAAKNPSGAGMDSFIFWAERTPGKPMENRLYLNGLRDALQKSGMSKEAAKIYTFHGWRHFYTSYMRERVTEKLLQSQTGHKSIADFFLKCEFYDEKTS
jgi:integrase